MHRTLVLLLALTGCETVSPAVAGRADVPETTTEPSWRTVSVLETVRTAEQLHTRVEALSPSKQAELTQAIQILSVNCPYTRASLQFPIALRAALAKIDEASLRPRHREELKALKHGLDEQVAALDLMGVTLPLPLPGDHLFSAADGRGLVERSTLEASTDPIAATMHLVNQNDAIVGLLDQATGERIRRNTDIAYDAMGPTSMYRQSAGWLEALDRLAPHVSEPASRARLDAMVIALEAHESQGC